MVNCLEKRYVESLGNCQGSSSLGMEQLSPNILVKYTQFIDKLEKDNQYFAKLICRHALLRGDKKVIETVPALEIQNVSDYLKSTNGIVVPTNYGKIDLTNDKQIIMELNSGDCYLSQGVFTETYTLVRKAIRTRASFIVGVAIHDEYNDDFYQKTRSELRKLLEVCKKLKCPVTVTRENQHHRKAYILSHQGDR